ncbi:MAG: phosphotransferase [Thermoflexibacter sp.]
MLDKLTAIAQNFALQGKIVSISPLGAGHINDTFLVKTDLQAYVIQRINHEVFKNPMAVMENIQHICQHQINKLKKENQAIDRKVLQVIPTKQDKLCFVDAYSNFWRTYLYVPDTVTFNIVENEHQAFQAGRGFGRFQRYLSDVNPQLLHETIPRFHSLAWRYEQLEEAIRQDTCHRVSKVSTEVNFALARKSLATQLTTYLSDGTLPVRVTHNDTKINNILMDSKTQEAVCIIDLDTVMAGSVIYDFGDLMRTSLSLSSEEEKDLSKVQLRIPIFKALAEGYLSEAKSFLTEKEKALLVFGGKIITLIMGIRFLTDYLCGDIYYKTKYKAHNLDRCRTQIQLVTLIEHYQKELEEIVLKSH